MLIDEIDPHLHPSMQAEILPRIAEVFPQVQLFATTHSPLVALDAVPDELVVLRRGHPRDSVVKEEAVPDFSGYSAEDMLADERLFDTEIYAPGIAVAIFDLKAIHRFEAEGNFAAAREFRSHLERFLLDDSGEYAAATRCVVRDPDAFSV